MSYLEPKEEIIKNVTLSQAAAINLNHHKVSKVLVCHIAHKALWLKKTLNIGLLLIYFKVLCALFEALVIALFVPKN